MNTTLHTTIKVCLMVLFFLVMIYDAKADQAIWIGSVSNSWEDADNWSTGKVPANTDTVTIESASKDAYLDKSVEVKMFTMSSGVMDLQKNNLVITDKAAFASGEILNGNVIVTGTGSATFSGTVFTAKVRISSNSIFLNGSVFNDSLFVTKKGKSNDLSKGGNMFNEPVFLTDSGDGSMVLSDSLTDVFKGQLVVTNFSKGGIYLAHRSKDNEFNEDVFLNGSNIFSNYYGTAIYSGNIFIDSPNGEIYFGVSEGSCTLSYGKKLSTPISTISAGKLFLRNFYSLDSLSTIKLDLGGSGQLYLETGTVFHDKVSFTAPSLFLNGATFNDVADFTNTGNSNVTSTGGCTFAKAMTLTKSGGATKIYSLSNTVQDTYHGSATFENTSGTFSLNNGLFKKKCTLKSNTTTGEGFYIAGAGSCTFKDSVVITKLDGPGMFFGGGIVLIDSASNLYFSSGIGGTAAFQKLTRAGTAPINIENGPDNLYLGPNNTFNSNFSYTGKAITLYGNTFQGITTIKLNGNTTTSSYGGNVFNGSTLIQDSSSTAHSLYLATGASDDYNGDVTFVQKGTGVSLYPAYTKNSTFAKNITLDGTTSMQLGGSGGKVILDGTTAQSITSGNTSLFPTIKKLQVNKASGSLTLYTPLTISDSLQLTQGRINTDTTNLLTVAHGGKVIGGSDNNYINGPMKKIGNTAFAFPLGSSSLTHPYHPLEITAPTSTTDAYTAIYIPTAQTIGTAIDTSIDNLNACQYWKLNRNSGTSKVKVKLGWNHDSCETISPTNFRVTGWNGTIWKDLGNSVTSGDSLQGMVQSSDSLNTISHLTLAFNKCSSFKKIVTTTNSSCKGSNDGSAKIKLSGGTPGYEYLWSGDLGENYFAKNLYPGIFTVQVNDSRNCVLFDTISIEEPDSVLISYTVTESQCNKSKGSAIVTASGGNPPYSFYWDYNQSTSNYIVNIPAGIYELSVSDSNGCFIESSIPVQDSLGPDVNIISQMNVNCFGIDSGMIEVEGADFNTPFKYQWSTSAKDTLSQMSNLLAGTYVVMVTNNANCKSVKSIEITQPDKIDIEIIKTNSLCGLFVGSATALVTGGVRPYSYLWSVGGSDSVKGDLSSGIDTVFITDSHGCESNSITTIVDSDGPNLTSHVLSNVSCFEDSSGSAYVEVQDAIPPFDFIWSPFGNNNDTLLNLQPGYYEVIVHDSNGCMQKTQLEIESLPILTISFDLQFPTSDSMFDGRVFAIVEGGKAPYQYSWSSGETTPIVSGLSAIEDTLTVTDANGCSATKIASLRLLFNNCFTCDNPPIPILCPPYFANCTASPCTLDIETNFGAIRNDGNSDECAFENAAAYLSSLPSSMVKVLTLKEGTYIVGRQEPFNGYHRYGVNVMCFDNVQNLTILGLGDDTNPTIIKFQDCMKFGAFDVLGGNPDDRYLTPLYTAVSPANLAYYGQMMRFNGCKNIRVSNIEFDGNMQNAIVGGSHHSDGIQLPYDAIFVNTTVDFIFDNLFIHDFGHDGIWIRFDYCPSPIEPGDPIPNPPRMNGMLDRVVIQYSGRNNLSWTGGKLLNIRNSEFSYAGQGRISMLPGSGIDIELESNVGINTGRFTDILVKYNRNWGIINDADDHGVAWNSKSFWFLGGDIVGSNTGVAIRPNSKFFRFNGTSFYGIVHRLYNARVHSLLASISNRDYTIFDQCNFYENYTDLDPSIGTNSFQLSAQEVDRGTLTPIAGCPVPVHEYLVDCQAPRTEFIFCTINTGFTLKTALLIGGPVLWNTIRIERFIMDSDGMNGCACDWEGASLRNIRITGPPGMWSAFQPPTFSSNPPFGFPNATGFCGAYYAAGLNGRIVPIGANMGFDPSFQIARPPTPLFPQFAPPIPVNLVTSYNVCKTCAPSTEPAFNPCVPPLIERRKNPNKKNVDYSSFNIFPNPAANYLYLTNIKEQGQVKITNIYGSLIYSLFADSDELQLDISSMKPGIYYVSILGSVPQKFIKM